MVVRLVAFTAVGWRQDGVTGGAEINFGGHENFIYVNSRGARGHEKFMLVWIKKKRSSVQKFPQILVIVSKFLRFFTNSLGKNKEKKKKSSSQKLYEIRCESTTITKIRAVNTNSGVLGLDLHFNSPEPLNSSGHSPRLGGTIFVWGGTSSHLGGTAPNCPRGAGPALLQIDFSTWLWAEDETILETLPALF